MNARVYKFRYPLSLVPLNVTVSDSRPLGGNVNYLVRERIKTLRLRANAPFPSEIREEKEYLKAMWSKEK